MQHPGPVRAARAEKRRLQAAGYGARPAAPEPEQIETVQEFFVRHLRLRERSWVPLLVLRGPGVRTTIGSDIS